MVRFATKPFCRAAGWMLLVLTLGACQLFTPREETRREVRDPHYGEVLFYFYQQKYFSSLAHLMTAQHFDRLPTHADEAELLRGGMLLSYGVHLEAGRIFERLIAQGAAPDVRNRAWFYLAKIRYQRGYLAESADALARIEGDLPGDLNDERQVLHALVLMREGKYQEAASHLERLKPGSVWGRYGRYNLGVALVRGGETERGMQLLTQLGHEPSPGEELAALRDKTNVALGFSLLQAGRHDEARTSLEQVRLSGLMTNKALLGMGWAQMAGEKPDRALVYWEELRQRNVLDAAVQESLLAVPFALGKLGAWRQSLQRYEEAGNLYTREIDRIDQSVRAIRAGKLTDALLSNSGSEETGWLWSLQSLPDTPETRYLSHLMATHDFQEALKNYRDLRFLIARLDQWAEDAVIYRDMLATRRQGFRERLPAVLQSRRALDQPRLMAERDRLRARLQEIEQHGDAEALANREEFDKLGQLESIRRRMSRQTSGDAEWERYRLLRGLMRWDIEVEFPARLWQARKSLHALDEALSETDVRRSMLARAREETPARLEAFEGRIEALAPRIRALQQRSRDLARAQADYLGHLAIAELDQQRERLATYQTQVRFAVAQIYDQSANDLPEAP